MKAGLESLESLHRCKQVCTKWNENILWDMDGKDKEEEFLRGLRNQRQEKSLLLKVEIINATSREYHCNYRISLHYLSSEHQSTKSREFPGCLLGCSLFLKNHLFFIGIKLRPSFTDRRWNILDLRFFYKAKRSPRSQVFGVIRRFQYWLIDFYQFFPCCLHPSS